MKKIYFLLLLFTSAMFAQIEKDKKLHFGAGVVAGGIGYHYFLQKTGDKKKAVIGGVLTSIVAGAGKEFIDSRMPGNRFDNKDLLATTLGGVSINLTISLFNGKRKNKYEKNNK